MWFQPQQKKMPQNKVVSAAFLISFAGHCLFLGSPFFNARAPQYEKKPKELTIDLEIEKSALLPKIDTMGQEKRLKKVEQEPEEANPQIVAEKISLQQIQKERSEEKIEPVDARKDAMLRYQDMVKQRIEEARRYPLWAKKQGIEGVVCLNFIVLPSGIGKDIRIVRSSGSSILDEEAVVTISRAQPFPLMPKEIGNSSVNMEVAIVFSLK